ncbi:MAG: hypothetical protein LBV00_01085 [Propionibacteriaceae bacterium]|nr:hypothetical protein [Propionibacteriaceae bacterium]
MAVSSSRGESATFWVFPLVGLASALAGCSAGPAVDLDAAGPYAAQFKQEYDLAQSDYVRQMLADGKVDTAELHDAQQHMVSCMADAGYTMEFKADAYGQEHESILMSHGSTPFSEEEETMAWDASGVCRNQWMGLADTLYYQVQTNPNNEDWDTLVAACLVRYGLAPDGFTGKDYEEFRTSVFEGSANDPNQDGPAPPLPGGKSYSDPAVARCEVVPLQ